MGGSLELLKITGYIDEDFEIAFPGDPYTVMLNPETIKWQRTIDYNEEQSPDSSSASQRYKSTPSDKVDFEIVLDCTGIIDPDRTDLKAEIDELEDIIFTYNGKIHRPNFVMIQWGEDITFKGVLTSFDISYTLFRPDGSPLRAKLSLSFSQYISPETVQMLDQEESQDITHLVKVIEGDTLPQLCQRTWNDDSCYIQVARFNDLKKFRNLRGIENLIFPPILQPS